MVSFFSTYSPFPGRPDQNDSDSDCRDTKESRFEVRVKIHRSVSNRSDRIKYLVLVTRLISVFLWSVILWVLFNYFLTHHGRY